MRDLGEVWRSIQANHRDEYKYQKRVIINGDIYHEAEIYSLSKRGGLIETDYAIGTAVVGRFDVSFIPHENIVIPRNAKVEFQVRLVYTGRVQFVDAANRQIYDSAGRKFMVKPMVKTTVIDEDGNEIAVESVFYTPWRTFGTYYIDKRTKEGRRLTLECYDTMLFTEQNFLKARGTIDNYPIYCKQ